MGLRGVREVKVVLIIENWEWDDWIVWKDQFFFFFASSRLVSFRPRGTALDVFSLGQHLAGEIVRMVLEESHYTNTILLIELDICMC